MERIMKILVIHGSMRKGNTYALTTEITNRLTEFENVTCTEVNVADLNLPFCCSCHLCFGKGEEFCPHYDSLRELQAGLIDCDGVVLSGTTYMWALNAAMKNLLDHLSYNFHRPVFFGKKGMVIATSSGNGEKSVAKYLKTVLGQWGVNGAIVVTQNAKEKKMISPDKINAKLDSAAKRFYEQVLFGKPKSPTFKSIAVHNAFRAMALSDFAEYERDTQYWKQSGYCDRAYPIKTAPLKYAVGAMMFSIAKNLTKMLGRGLEKS